MPLCRADGEYIQHKSNEQEVVWIYIKRTRRNGGRHLLPPGFSGGDDWQLAYICLQVHSPVRIAHEQMIHSGARLPSQQHRL